MNRYIIRYYLTPGRCEDNTIEAETFEGAIEQARLIVSTAKWLTVDTKGCREHFRMSSIDRYLVMEEGASDPDELRRLKATHDRLRNRVVINHNAPITVEVKDDGPPQPVCYSPDFLARKTD